MERSVRSIKLRGHFAYGARPLRGHLGYGAREFSRAMALRGHLGDGARGTDPIFFLIFGKNQVPDPVKKRFPSDKSL